MRQMAIVNCGHKDYGYKKDLHGLLKMGVPVEALDINPNKIEKYMDIALKAMAVIEIVIVAFDLCVGTTSAASLGPTINLEPLNTFQHEVWLLMLRGILYLAIPVYGWCGYIFALAGQNAGKRTAAKWLALSMTGGVAFVAGAPWAGDAVYNFFKGVFHV